MANAKRPHVDTAVAHGARMYDYWLGGKDNYAADRLLGDMIRREIPTVATMARANRAFLERSVRFLAEAGITQFLDIGTGIPTAPNVHQVAQAVDPASRVVYVDVDPLVLTHARALMSSTPEGRTAFIVGDVLDPEAILSSPELVETLDLDQPVGVLLIAVLMYLDAQEGKDPYPAVQKLIDAFPSGSYLVVSHPTGDFDPRAMQRVREMGRQAGLTILPRNRDDSALFLRDMELVEPGVVPVLAWRPESPVERPRSAYFWAGVGRKP